MRLSTFLLAALLLVPASTLAQDPANPGQPAAPTKDLYEKLRDKEKENVASFKKALDTARTDSLAKATPADGKLTADQLAVVGQAWTNAVQKIVENLAPKLGEADVAVLKDEKLDLQSLEALSDQMQKSNAEIVQQLQESAAAGNPLPKEGTVEKAQVETTLTEAVNALVKTLTEALETRRFMLLQVARGKAAAPAPRFTDTGAPLPRAAVVERDQEEEFLQMFTTDSGTSPVIRCQWQVNGGTRLDCKPKGLLISGQEISEIRITGLPANVPVTVRVITSEEKTPPGSGTLAGRMFSPELDAPCPGDGPAVDRRQRLSCDELRLTRHGGEALIAIHTERYFRPSYGGRVSNLETAVNTLRRPNREKLSLVVNGLALEAVVAVQLENDERTTQSAAVPLAYQRWGFETGAFMAVTRLTDQELITVPDPATPANIIVREKEPADNYRQQTGIFLNFIPQNYRFLGIGLGFSTESNRPLSLYVGPNVRLLSFGSRGLASLSTGIAMIPVRRFPGVGEGESIPSTSKLLEGKIRYHTQPYVLLQLGFSFGPIGGSTDK